jgi:hypothetical protein
MQRIRVPRRNRQDLLINLTCLGEATSALQSLAMLQMSVDLAVLVAHWPGLIRSEMAVRTYRVLRRHGSPPAIVTRRSRRGQKAVAQTRCRENPSTPIHLTSRHPGRSTPYPHGNEV